MSNAPVTQAEIEAIRTSFRTERVLEILHKLSRMTPVELDEAMEDMSILRVCQFDILLRAIAERDATIQSLKDVGQSIDDQLVEQQRLTKDAREDLANYRGSAEERIAQLRDQLANKDMTIGGYIKREQDMTLDLARCRHDCEMIHRSAERLKEIANDHP